MKRAFHILLIAIIGLLAYSNTFKVPFQLDDVPLIVNDPIIYDFNFLNLYKTVKSRYIGYLTFALNYKLHQFDVRGYHIFNLTIHILNAILVYWLMALTLTIHDTRFTIHDKGNTPLVPPVLRGELKGGIVHHASWIVHHHL
ncbi:MAG: hypothetical protein HY754_07005, partial [Nitrospirae bacterium]|nr:hypothetical protein [Nitrospirota bacterium]